MLALAEKKQIPNNGPLRRSTNKKKRHERSAVTNDVIELHSRMMSRENGKILNISADEAVLASRITTWKQHKQGFLDVQATLETSRNELIVETNKNKRSHKRKTAPHDEVNKRRKKKVKSTREQTALRVRRSKLHHQLRTELDSINKTKEEIRLIKDGGLLHAYILDAIPFLNIHHSLTSDVLSLRAKLDRNDVDTTKLEIIKQINNLKRNLRANAHDYCDKFYKELVRDDDKDREDEMIDYTICKGCGGEVSEVSNSHCVCNDCGLVASTGFSMVDASRNMNWEDLRNAPGRQYTYRRLNHFREYMRQIQGQSRASIPDEIYEDLREEFRKAHITSDNINSTRIREKLKKIGQSKYYEHAESIAASLSGGIYKPVNIDPIHEEKLCLMFVQLEEPYDVIKHLVLKGRKNFFSYPFAFFKLCELCGYDAYVRSCSLLKSPALINRQDKWWNLVMAILGWESVGRTFDVMRNMMI